MEGATQERYADKIAKLLRKAEATNHAGEAEVFVAKAQELMTQYAIDEAMVHAAKDGEKPEEIIEEEIKYSGVYHAALFDIGRAVARANDCKTLIGRFGNATVLYVVGFKSDVDRVRMLDASVQIQATGALTRWWRAHDNTGWMSAMQKFKERRTFLFGFAAGLNEQLQDARSRGREAAVQSAVERGDDNAEESVALVVRTRAQSVQDWYDRQYGQTTRVTRRCGPGSHGARSAGLQAGVRADVSGRQGVGGQNRELGR